MTTKWWEEDDLATNDKNWWNADPLATNAAAAPAAPVEQPKSLTERAGGLVGSLTRALPDTGMLSTAAKTAGAAIKTALTPTREPKPVVAADANVQPTDIAAPKPASQKVDELRPYTPTLFQRFAEFVSRPNRDRATVELVARQIAKRENIPVEEVYKQAGGSRSLFNPEGRNPVVASVEAAQIVAKEVPKIPAATANTVLRVIQGSDVGASDRNSFLDRLIKATEVEDDKNADPNYESFNGLGKSFGYSLTTLVSSAVVSAGATAVSGPVGGVVAAAGTSTTVAYRASKNEFLERVRDNLDKESKKVFQRPLSADEWAKARGDFESAAIKYGAWEAIPETVSNLIFLRAFGAPLKTAAKSKVQEYATRAIRSVATGYVPENITETITGLGQNAAEIEAGLETNALTLQDAFKQQFIPTLFLTGGTAGAATAVKKGSEFYEEKIEPIVSPESAFSRALESDVANTSFANTDAEARARLDPRNYDPRLITPAETVRPTSVSFTPPDSPTRAAGLPDIVVPLPAAAPTTEGTPNVSASDATQLATAAGSPVAGNLPGAGLGAAGLDPSVGRQLDTDTGRVGAVAGAAGALPDAGRQQPAGVAAAGLNNANTQPVEQWAGRNGEGYATRADAEQGLEKASRVKMFPNLQWSIEQMPDGKYRLAGYPSQQPAAPAASQAPAALAAPAAEVNTALAPQTSQAAAILQNRNRSTPVSVVQMRSIASNPDYGRLGFSRDFANGAPVVAGGQIAPEQLGRKDIAVAADGRRIPVQYAVVEAASLLPSNSVDGTPNSEYGDTSLNLIRAIAGNGRVAGLQSAFEKGTAENYVSELQNDAMHGVDQGVIEGMQQPVLVRVMPMQSVTADIGDVSNTVGNLNLSPVEQANNDAQRVSLEALQFAEDGSITPQAVRQFVSAMPQAEQGGLVDTNGQPTKQAVDRINAAVFARAYGSDQLVRLYAQAQDPEARLLLSALAQVAPKMARLEGAGALDIRSLVTAAVEIAVNARRNGMSIQRAAQQLDMTADPDVEVLLNLFARNNRSNKEVVKALSRAADFAYREASKPAVDMFGDVPRATRSNVVQQLEVQDEQASQATLEDSAGGFFADQDAVGRAAGQERPGALGQTETRRSTQEGEVTDVPQAPQAQQAEAQQPETPAALARDSGTDLNVPQQPLLDSDSGKPFGGAQTAAAIRVEAQRDLAAGKDKKKRVPVLGTPDPKVEKAINELGSAIAQAFGIKPFTVAYSDPGGTNGFAYNGIAFINTALDQDSVSAPRTGLHEGFHIAEQMAAAGNENAQRFVAEMYKIYDDIIEQGKLNYIENFFYKTELDKLYNPDKGTGNPAAREKRIKEILQSPELRSEMVADFLGNRANDRGFFNDLAKADPKGFEAFVKKWLDIIDNLIAHLRGGPQQSRKESALVDKYIRDLNKGRMIARDALIAFRRGNLEAQGQADVQAEGQAQRQAGAQATAAPGAAASAKQAGVTPKSRRPKTQQSAVNQGPAFDGPETGDTPIGKATEIEVDGETRPALNSNGQPIYPTQEGVRNFWRWFGDSKVVDAQGRPVVVYHGTGNLENLQAFDPALTGKGNDQIGSGFYFTTDPEEAGGYTTAVTQNAGPDATKLGGDTSPGVAPVYLAISNPITVKGSNLVDTEIELTHKQALAIIKRTPNIRDLDESPIGNWIDVWGAGKITDKMISEVAQNYTGASLISLEGDFFRGNAAAFREALRDTIGRDGVTQDFGGKAHWVAWFPTQIKSATGNRGTFDPKEKRIDFSPRQRTPLGFYSALADGVQQMKASALPVVGWKDAIKGMLNKGQIKQDEVEWTGINDWLDLQQGKVTKEQVQEYLNANGVQVEEVVLGEDNSLVDAWWNDEGGANEETPFEDLTAAEQAEARTRFQDEVGQYEEGATKFSQYVLPGGENYREVLLTLPYEKRGIGNLKEGESLVAALDRAQQNNPVFRSSHWDQPNVIAHIRMNDRTDADGKRVLFVEELQSDWSAEGRKQGFADPTARDKAAEISAEMDSLAEDREQPSNRIRDEQRWLDLAKQRDEFLRKADGTPSAPFVTKTEGWLNLSLKRVIAMAADGGYDRVAFINGEQSADRYDLSKTVKSIRTKWSDSARDERKVDVFVGDNVIGMIVDADGKVIGSMTNGMNGKQLDEVIGKEMAKKVMETNGDGKWSGLDLKVGGEGMRGFYDKIVPAAVNKLLPKLGGGRMGAVNLSDQRFTVSKDSAGDTWGYVDDGGSGESGFATRAEAQAAADADNSLETGRAGEQPGFDITPAIRQKVEEGLPMFSRKQGETDADPDDIDILDSKKQRGVVELDKDGLILDNPRLSDVDRSLKINPKTVLRLFESATDKLRRSGSPKLKELATRVDRYFDQVEARAGKFNGRIRPAMKGIKEADLKVFEQYWRDFDNGRKAEAEKLLAANPKVLRLVRAVKDSFAAAGAENQSVGVKVFDSKTGEWRPIGKVGDFWPRVIRDEVARELESGGTTNPELWNEMLDALVEGGQVETKEEATRYIRNYFSSETSNDYFAGIERARGEKLPEMFYNYSWDVVPNYFHKWSQRVSQIENFGQVTSPGTEDFFDKVKAGVVDRATANYITAVQQRVYDVRQNTISNNLMANLNILATGLQLGNPATATLNYLGGTTLNVQMFGYGRVTKAQLDLARDFEAIMQEGTELGILGKDTMMILKDNDFRTEGYLSDEDRLAAGLRGFTSFTMKWGGYNGTEQIIRATAFVAARAQLNDALQAWQDKPKGITARKYNAFMERNRIDKDALIEENGAGEETAKYLRLMVNIPQGSYRIDQTPIYVDTPIGRFFFKYQKFATQVSRMYWEQNLKPLFNALTGKSEESVLTAVERNLRWFSAAFLGGTAILAARSALFGLQDPGPDEEELEKALRSDDNGFKMLLLFERAWSSMMAASALGMFGGIAQMTRDIADRQRVRFDPMNPPGFSAFLAVKELILRAHEQGKLTVRDIDDLATQTVALYRSNKRLAASAGNALDLDIREFQIEQARRDVAYVRKVAKWFARENKLEGRVTTAARYGLSPNTPVNRQIYEAVILNDFDLAMKLAEKEHDRIQELDGEKDEWKRRRQSILSSLRTRHPANIKEINNKEDREAFLEWVENKLPKSKQKMVIDMVNNYEDNISDLRKSMPK